LIVDAELGVDEALQVVGVRGWGHLQLSGTPGGF
jgi:hypothetical protein